MTMSSLDNGTCMHLFEVQHVCEKGLVTDGCVLRRGSADKHPTFVACMFLARMR